MIIERDLAEKLKKSAQVWPSITLTGPRQSGKTTLCRHLFPNLPYATLEAPDIRFSATEDPRGFLARFPQGAILDEVQRVPDLLSYLQGIIDDDSTPGRWILTSSQNLSLLESVSQSLAGRTAIYYLLPLTHGETTRFPEHPETLEETLFTGSYPRIFDARLEASEWHASYIATYIDRDVRMISNVSDLETFHQFLKLCSGRSAQLLNYSSLSDDCGISQPTVKAWLNILETSFLILRLPAYRSNLRKKLVKMPKLFFYDTGLLCWLLGIRSPEQLYVHPLRGAIFETWVVSEIVKNRFNRGEFNGLSFYRDRNGAEVDLVVEHSGSILLVEAKSAKTASTSLFKSSKRVQKQLARSAKLCPITVVYGGDDHQQRGINSLIPWRDLHQLDWSVPSSIISVQSAGQPISGANVLVLFPNKTWKSAVTDENGSALFNLHSAFQSMTVFLAVGGFAAHLESAWIPADGVLNVELTTLPDGGAVIFPNAVGHVPVLYGQINPVLDTENRTYLYTDNIAINGGLQQPVDFTLGEELHLCDADGREASVRIISIVGKAALVQYQSS